MFPQDPILLMEILDLSLLDPIDPPGCEEDNEAQKIRHAEKDSRSTAGTASLEVAMAGPQE